MTDRLIVITGPTASGKSDIALKVAQAFDGEIISADSQQVYKEMNIGTNKTLDTHGINQHLIDIKYPNEEFSVEEFKTLTTEIITDINDRGKLAILVGGTGFYIDSILFDMNYGAIPKDEGIREKLSQINYEKGSDYLHQQLKTIDPETADKYHPNEINRIMRALEIYEMTGEKPSNVRTGEKILNPNINPLVFFLNYDDRTSLYQKINNRVIQMIEEGLIEEFVDVFKKYQLTPNSQSMAAIGYKEIFPFISEEIDIDQLIDLIQKNTRHYAKRQVTWMKRYLDYGFTHEIKMDNLEKNDAADIIISIIKEIYEF